MTIATYSDLISTASEYLARENDATLVARIPDFITLCEAKLNRIVFHPSMEKRSTVSVDTTDDEPEFVTLPTDLQTVRRIRLSSVTGKPRILFVTQSQLEDYRFTINNATGQPVYYTIVGDELELAPTPDDDYTLEMVYRSYIPALNDSNTTNWLLTLAPDVYLYGVLLESAPYIKEDDRASIWGAAFTAAVDQLNMHGSRQAFAGPLAIKLTGAITP